MPPTFRRNGHLIELPALDANGAGGLLCVGFRIRRGPNDTWTNRFMEFKLRRPGAVKRAAAVVVHALESARLPGHDRVVVVGAISSADEVLTVDNPVHHLGRKVANAFDLEWRPKLLSKTAHTALHTMTTMRERDETIRGVYSSSRLGGPAGLFVIVDDLATRGSTFAEIRRALSKGNPGWAFLNLALAKNENYEYWGDDISNDHIPAELARVWEDA